MRERQLIDAIHRLLPKSLFRQGMTGAAMTGNGIPDYYYDGPKRDLWIEYKQLKAMPRDGNVRLHKLATPLQLAWLARRGANGANAYAIVGVPNKRALVFRDYDAELPVEHAKPYKEVAAWICAFCGCS